MADMPPNRPPPPHVLGGWKAVWNGKLLISFTFPLNTPTAPTWSSYSPIITIGDPRSPLFN
ncbi:hypothetical protein Vi05172_g12067 [Venturia inaequalis]|nr:hypothetical protein Vi05172_g12067 [Venturia inaequalis]